MTRAIVVKNEIVDRLAIALASLSSGAAWLVLLMRPPSAAAGLGVLCAHAGSVKLHCPACYMAAALMAFGAARAWGALRLAKTRRADFRA